ncbi:hypothetical protein [Actinomadura sp. 9N407]|uniref:hypothetical protein n=1 Tax=Actinomadura sp. 9N407 TaxID=3375154 RepID=UPI00379963B8
MKARSLLTALVGAVLVVSAGTAAYTLLWTPDGPFAEGNADPRTAKGSDPRISFERAADDLRLRLPPVVSEVRYLARHDSRPYFLWFSFVTSCSAFPEFATDNDLVRGSVKQADSIALERLRKLARDLGRPIPEGPTATVWTDENENDSTNRAVATTHVENRECQVVGAFEAYS